MAITKYDYIGVFQASGGPAKNALPSTETRSLNEAVGYLAAINNGELRAAALVEGEGGKLVTVVAVVKYDAIIGKSDEKIYELLDRSIDTQIEGEKSGIFDPWGVDLNKIFPRN